MSAGPVQYLLIHSHDNIYTILSMDRNIGFKERRYIEELRILTKATALDCIIDEKFERIVYIIRPGDMGLAIGKKGENIRRMQNVLGKRIEMV
jgi:N utilization substance protein A